MNMPVSDFEFLSTDQKMDKEQTRPSLTYWKDSWRRLKTNKGAMVGLIGIIFIVLVAFVLPLFLKFDFDDQNNSYMNIPPQMEIYQVDDGVYFYLADGYYAYSVSADGELLSQLTGKHIVKDVALGIYEVHYEYQGEEVVVDYSYIMIPAKGEAEGIDFSFIYKGVETKTPYDKVWNKTYVLGSDQLGRDMLARVLQGARISLTIAVVATFVNLLIGVTYGAISGYEGGNVDNVMMRIIDVIDSIPLLLYVILLMVVLQDRGLGTIILTLGLLYWVSMARLVRGQVLQLKEQEYVLAARMIGVSKTKIIFRHLIPNALGPILVSMTMHIPTAIFTEAFLSYIGLGISAPMASWGTMANDGAKVMEDHFYQLLEPSVAIAFTMLCFNFFGDGMRSAFDPRLRRG
jgi:oligopeptide transport system permease protein